MLVDVNFRDPNGTMNMVLSLISNGRPIIPKRISRGLYLSSHWSINQLGVGLKDPFDDNLHDKVKTTHLVCDEPQQAVDFLKLDEIDVPVFAAFVEVRRNEQPANGGWRWHKWGEYIGKHKPEHEYLYDEAGIDRVYTCSVYFPS